MALTPKFLQRLVFSPGGPQARPAIVQYHLQAESEFAKRQGYVMAFVEPCAVEHGHSLAAGPGALDLLDRIVKTVYVSNARDAELIDEARELLKRATPPGGSVNPNGTPRDTCRERGR